jgi:hypothetical protein
VLMRVANFYSANREIKQALRLCAAVLGSTDADDAMVFDSYNAHQIPASDVLPYGMPQGSRAPQAYLRYLISLGDFTNADVTWRWLVSHLESNDRTAIEYVNFLFEQQRYESGAEAWASYVSPSGDGYLQSNWIYNGGFERQLSESALDWNIQKLPNVTVGVMTTIVHSGKHSLQITFDGTNNVTYNHVNETVFVRDGDYKFEAFIRCRDITPDQGVGFHIYDPETPIRVDVKTRQLVGNQDWTKIEQIISVPPGTRLLRIEVMRQPTWKLFDNATTGTAWIDDVKLQRFD